jgi:hypothetical protein
MVIEEIEKSDLLSLIKEYNLYVDKLSKDIQNQGTRTSWDAKYMLKGIKDIKRINVIAHSIFQELRKVDVYTIDEMTQTVFARTTIELDADIVTLVRPGLFGHDVSQKNILLAYIHRCNVHLVIYLFMYRFNEFFLKIEGVLNIVRVISVLLWILPNLFVHFTFTDPTSTVVQAINLIGIPIILVRIIVPKIFRYVMRDAVISKIHLQSH